MARAAAAPASDIEELAKEFYDTCRVSVRQEVRDRVRMAKQTGSLDLLGMAVEVVPESFGRHLPALTSLAINTNSIKTLPASLSRLRTLQTLICRHNLLESLPPLTGLNALLTMDVSSNALTALPASIGELPVLHHIDCNSNQLAALPAELCHLRALQTLLCHSNQLEQLPDEMGALPALVALDASRNLLEELPESLGYARKLVSLDLSTNRLRQMPASIGQLHCLQKLTVARNPHLRMLPSLGLMASLVRAARGTDLGLVALALRSHGLAPDPPCPRVRSSLALLASFSPRPLLRGLLAWCPFRVLSSPRTAPSRRRGVCPRRAALHHRPARAARRLLQEEPSAAAARLRLRPGDRCDPAVLCGD